MRPAWAPSRRTLGGAALAEGSVHATQEYVLNPDLLLQLPPHEGLLVRKVPELEVRHLRLHPADGGRRGPGAPPQEGDAVPAARA